MTEAPYLIAACREPPCLEPPEQPEAPDDPEEPEELPPDFPETLEFLTGCTQNGQKIPTFMVR